MTCRPVTGDRHHHTPAPLPKAFHEEPGRMVSRGRQNLCRRLWHTPKISRKLLESENLVCSAAAGTKIALGVIQFRFICFAASFSRHLALTFPGRLRKEMSL